jgi:alpha-L-fucosidase
LENNGVLAMSKIRSKRLILISLIWLAVLGSSVYGENTKPFPAKMPMEKPTDRKLSAAVERLYDQWNPHEDRGNELYSNFKYSRLEGFSYDNKNSRRDPTKVLKINGTYYVWYTYRRTEAGPAGAKNATDTIPSTDWDLAEIWYATSKDGFKWKEQGPAVKRAPKGEYGWRSVSTPDVLVWGGKYYLYYQGFNEIPGLQGDRAAATVAEADSPDGPWRSLGKVVVDFGKPGEWDSNAIHDPYPLVYKGKIYLYYKGSPGKGGREGTIVRAQGVAIADHPLGPFKKSPLNPVLNSGHETCLFPWKQGIAAIVSLDGPEKNTVQYAPDGVNFQMMSILQVPPIAPGPFVPDAFADNGDGRGITWGLCHIIPDGGKMKGYSMLARFDCDLSLDVDRPIFKNNNLRFEERTYFEERIKLPDYLRRQIDSERKKVDINTKTPAAAPDVPGEYQKAIEQKVLQAEQGIARGPYKADYENLISHNEAPDWYRDAKFGIYFHWGVYSVPESGHEWYPCNMHRVGDTKWGIHDYHMKTYGGPVKHPYDKFVPGLTASKFDADEWVDLFVKAGAKFAGPVAEHHDGYSMWDSSVTPWNAADTGPKRDITGELEKAIRGRGLKFITTFHHARNGMQPDNIQSKSWHYSGALMDYPQILEDPKRAFLYGYMPRWRFEQLWLAKLVEVVDAYQPDLIWFDSWLDRIAEYRREQFLAYYLNRAKDWDKDVVITFKQEDLPKTVALEDFERGRLNALSEHCWLTDDTITADRSWCYVKDVPLKTTEYLVHVLADIVSKNGCLLLNIAPKSDGTIPDDQREVLLGMGDWLKINGEAIYDTRPWKIFGEGPTQLEKSGGFVEELSYTSKDFRFTQSKNGNMIYVIMLGRPESKKVTVKSLAADSEHLDSKIASIKMIGSSEKIQWSQDKDGLNMIFPKYVRGRHAFVWKITLVAE